MRFIQWLLTLLLGVEEGFCQHCGEWTSPIFDVEESMDDGSHRTFAACDPCLAKRILSLSERK